MKKLTLTGIAAIALLAVSCKKDYTCTCTYTSSYDGIQEPAEPADVVTIKDVSKGTAKSICKDYEYTYTNTSISGSGSSSSSTGTEKATCNLD